MHRLLSIVLLLAGAIGLCFWQALGNGFINFDDPQYITANSTVQAGLTWDGVRWAFTTFHAANWHPVTWLSHMLDVQTFALQPAGHHAVNLILHLINSVLVYLVLWKMTDAMWRSVLVAVMFAIHPLHVESVAWIAERKDLLSACFGLAAIWFYVGFTHRRSISGYLLVVICFVLSLLAKPMLVTLPVLLLVLDVWPLRRNRDRQMASLAIEKIPLFAVAAASCVMAFIAQRAGGAQDAVDVPVAARFANALVAYAAYVQKTVWPVNLAVLYPHPIHRPWPQVAIAGAIVLSISAFVIWQRRHRHLIVGWLWFLGTLVPVIGLVQVGRQAMADRYTYIPLIGLFIMIAWSLPVLREGRELARAAMVTAILAALAGLALTTRAQVERWRTSVTLFEHTVAVTSNNAVAHNNLGEALLRENRASEAAEHFARAVEIRPDYALARMNLGGALLTQQRTGEAMSHLRESVRLDPELAQAHALLGLALSQSGLLQQARAELETAIRLNPKMPNANRNLGQVHARMGLFDEAIAAFEQELRLNANDAQSRALIEMARRDRERRTD